MIMSNRLRRLANAPLALHNYTAWPARGGPILGG